MQVKMKKAYETQDITLLKAQKEAELRAACSKEITDGYLYTVGGIQYRFSFDLEAQANFLAATRLMERNTSITSVPWTAYQEGVRTRINLVLTDLYGMEVAQFEHKGDCTSKLNDLLINHLYPAQAQADVVAITWG